MAVRKKVIRKTKLVDKIKVRPSGADRRRALGTDDHPFMQSMPEQWNGFDISKPSRALVAVGTNGQGSILQTVGGCIQFASKYNSAEVLLKSPQTPKEPGLYVWEGHFRVVGGRGHIKDRLRSVGEFRDAELGELEEFSDGKDIWDAEAWKINDITITLDLRRLQAFRFKKWLESELDGIEDEGDDHVLNGARSILRSLDEALSR
jgi:hypothetical protein